MSFQVKISLIIMAIIRIVKAIDTKRTIFQIIINFYSKEKMVIRLFI